MTLLERLTPGRRVAAWALADQALVSAANFLSVILVARALPPDAFGIYTVAFTTLYISNTIQSALIAEPHAVLSASRSGQGYADFTRSTALLQLAVVALVAIAAVLAALAVSVTSSHGPLVLALGGAAIGWQLKEFGRRVLYVEDRMAAAFLNDLLTYGGSLALVLALSMSGLLTEVTAILAFGIAAMTAALLGSIQVRRSLAGRAAMADIVALVQFGKWLVASELTGIVSLRLWTYLVAAIAGAAAAGAYGAATLVFGPINVIVFTVANVLPIRLARARHVGDATMVAMLRRFHLWTVPPVAAICLSVALLAEPISTLLFQGKYPGLGPLVAILAVYSVIRYLQALAAVALATVQQTRAIFLASLVGGAATLATGWWLVATWGAIGAAVGVAIATAATLVADWIAFVRSPRPSASPEVTDGATEPDPAPTPTPSDPAGASASRTPSPSAT